jgi:hypothetical protein
MQLSRQTREAVTLPSASERPSVVGEPSNRSFSRFLQDLLRPLLTRPPFSPLQSELLFFSEEYTDENGIDVFIFLSTHPLPRLLLSSCISGKVPPAGGQALLQFWKHLQNLISFSASGKKR